MKSSNASRLFILIYSMINVERLWTKCWKPEGKDVCRLDAQMKWPEWHIHCFSQPREKNKFYNSTFRWFYCRLIWFSFRDCLPQWTVDVVDVTFWHTYTEISINEADWAASQDPSVFLLCFLFYLIICNKLLSITFIMLLSYQQGNGELLLFDICLF